MFLGRRRGSLIDGGVHSAIVRYADKRLDVRFDGEQTPSFVVDVDLRAAGAIDQVTPARVIGMLCCSPFGAPWQRRLRFVLISFELTRRQDGRAWVGFTASTGIASIDADLLSFSFCQWPGCDAA